MASNGLTINIAANVSEAVRGMEKTADSVEEVAQALHDLTERGRSTDELEDDFRKLQKETDRTADVIRSKFRDAYRDAARSSKRAADDMDDDLDKTGRAFGNLKDEARQSGAEAAASFSGEFSDVTDVVQEVAANLGPAGIAGAAVIGSIIGLATASVEGWNEKIAGIKESTAEMWREAAEAGGGFVDQAAINAEAYRLLWDEAYRDQFKAAEDAGVKASDLAIALATGEGDVFDAVTERIKAGFKERAEAGAVGSEVYREQGEAAAAAAYNEAGALGGVLGLLSEKQKAVERNKDLAREAADVTATSEQQQREQIQRTRDAAQSRYEGLADLYRNPLKAKVEVDDTALRNYRPPKVTIDTQFRSPSGQLLR